MLDKKQYRGTPHLRLLLKKRAMKTSTVSKILKSQMSGGILRSSRKKYSTLSLGVRIPSQVQTIGGWKGQFGALWALTHASHFFLFSLASLSSGRGNVGSWSVPTSCVTLCEGFCFLALVLRLYTGMIMCLSCRLAAQGIQNNVWHTSITRMPVTTISSSLLPLHNPWLTASCRTDGFIEQISEHLCLFQCFFFFFNEVLHNKTV